MGGRGTAGPLLRAIKAHRWIVVLVALVTVIGAGAYAAVRTPTYSAQTNILFTPVQSGEPTEGLPLVVASADTTRDVQTGLSLLGGPQATALAASRLGPGWTPRRVVNATVVEQLGQSNVIAVIGHASSAGLAARLASTYAASVLDVRYATLRRDALALSPSVPLRPNPGDVTDVSRRAEINLILGGQDPNFPSTRAGTTTPVLAVPSRSLILGVGVVGGLGLGILVAIILELFSDRVADSNELRDAYPVPVVAHFPVLPRRRRNSDAYEASDHALPASAELLARRLEARAHGPQVILATAFSAGDGTTTVTLELARALISAGRSVLLIDGDLTGADATRRLGLDRRRPGLADALAGDVALTHGVVSPPGFPELSFLPAGLAGRRAPQMGSILREVVADARQLADFVLLDTAPLGSNGEMVSVLADVDEILVVARPGHTRRADVAVLSDLLDASEAGMPNVVVVADRPSERWPPAPHPGRVRATPARLPSNGVSTETPVKGNRTGLFLGADPEPRRRHL